MYQGGQIQIEGAVGNVVQAGPGAVVNVYVTQPAQGDIEAKSHLIHLLLRKGELSGTRRMLENISFKLYGSRYFKSLTSEQLITLHAIADEVVEVLYQSRGRYAVAAKSVSDLPTV